MQYVVALPLTKYQYVIKLKQKQCKMLVGPQHAHTHGQGRSGATFQPGSFRSDKTFWKRRARTQPTLFVRGELPHMVQPMQRLRCQNTERVQPSLREDRLKIDVKDNKIHPITISDHAPVSLSLTIQLHVRSPTRWRFNTSLLEDPDFISMIKKEWALFLEMNDSPEISPSLLWETGKAVISGR